MGMVTVKLKLKRTCDARRSRMVGDRNLLGVTTLEALEPVLTLIMMGRVA